MGAKNPGKRNLTISLERQTIRKAKIVAARRSTSISGLLAQQIEILIGEEEVYERAQGQAMTLLDRDFRLGTQLESDAATSTNGKLMAMVRLCTVRKGSSP